MKRLLICLSVIFVGLVIINHGVFAETPKRGGTLYVALLQDMWTMDPINIQTTTGERVIHDVGVGECLYDWDVGKGEFVPRLATALPNISEDGKTYIIPIRKGVKFHDGTQYGAHAAAYSINRILDPANKSYILKKYKDVDKVEAIDDYTLKITLKKPDNAFMVKLATRDVIAVSKKAVEKYGKDFGTKAFVGTGPFKFVEWLQGDRIVVERFEDYWQEGIPYLDRIVFKFIPEESTALMQLRLGEVHILEDVARKDIKTLKEDKNVTVKLVTGIQHEQIYLNTKMKPFNDIRVRRAFAHAIDRQAIIEGVFEGYAMESVGPYHPWFWTHNPKHKQPYPYDPEKAKRLLKEAGYGPGNPLKFELLATNQDMFVDQAVMIQAFMADIGAKVEVLPLDKSTLFDRVYVRKAFKGKPELYQAALEDWGSSVVDPESAAERLFTSDSGSNKCFYANPEVDKLFEEVNFAKTLDEQKKIYYKTEEIIARDVPTIWICNPQDATAYRKEVKGFKPDGENRMPLATVWLEK
ncbi:MAG: ABC transporter substrate-binding protein [Deltaproteobacteria bacterium]|nr:ABC transporter substrate-binding protein [Deltaproteobacteria bacterium]